MKKRLAIIANGEKPLHPEVMAALRQCDACVCCDCLPPEGAPPLLQVVGDMDTLCDMLPADLVTDCHEDQETNDLTKAMRWVQAHEPEAEMAFFAVTGKREDHTLANLALIAASGKSTQVFTESGRFDVLIAGETTLDAVPQTPISFLSFVPQRITARGVVWPVEQLLLESLWRATLNRTSASQVNVTCEAPLLVYRPWSASC
jgi:thiamine pyrophosphokinase